MNDQLDRRHSKQLFIILSLFLVGMTIALTVVQVTKQQSLQSSADTTITNCTVDESLLADDNEEYSLAVLINDYRVKNNLPSLGTSADLTRAAVWNSRDMAQRGAMNHTDSAGRDPMNRVMDCGFSPVKAFGENLAKGQSTADDVFNGWKNSAGHNENLLCQKCTHMGVARVRVGNGDWYWTFDAAASEVAREPTLPESTVSPSVSATVTIPEPTDGEGTPSPTPTPEITLPPAQTELPPGTTGIMAKVMLYGVNPLADAPPLHPNRSLTVTILTPEEKKVAEVTSIISFDPKDMYFKGAVALPDTLETGTYIVKLKTDRSITKILNSGYVQLEKGQVLTPDVVPLQNVDLDENNVINFADILAFRTCLADDACPKNEKDLNDDGKVNILDYAVFYLVFGFIQGQ